MKKLKKGTRKARKYCRPIKAIQIGSNQGHDDFATLVKENEPEHIDLLVLVEPQSTFNELLEKCYKGYSPKIENVAINLDEKISEETLFIHEYHWLASMKADHIAKHGFEAEGRIKVPAMTINRLFEKHDIRTLDILFIDAEGLDDQIIMSIDFDKYKIESIYFEHLHIDSDNLTKFLEKKNYVVESAGFKDDLTSVARKKSLLQIILSKLGF